MSARDRRRAPERRPSSARAPVADDVGTATDVGRVRAVHVSLVSRLMSGEWFDEARFGMFVHWDHASQQGLEVSWPMAGGIFALPAARTVSIDQYQSSAATFDPQEWDPRALASLARAAGMGYAVITAKHHAGFAMFHTKLSDFSIAKAPYGRDIVGEFVEAVRAAGLRVGIYFSLSDWHHPDYPALTEADKPYAFGQSPPPPGPPRAVASGTDRRPGRARRSG